MDYIFWIEVVIGIGICIYTFIVLLFKYLEGWCSNPRNDPAALESPSYLQDPYDDGHG